MLVNTNTAQKASFNQFSNNATDNKPKSDNQIQKPAQDKPDQDDTNPTKEQHDQKENADKK
ncbi:hypothetical protein OC498_11710 [Acinetobacter bohemicus]|uniref:hypothetical protein n=1 Tax=Acinetobacter TaxID=469 RepID=UPI00157CB164|nr:MULTISPECIES: hypothetical protein [Acinetobacter]MCO8043252.1 hypothetical protein [Acinetobacter sp. S4400-12]MCU7225559.1 hypothetical protein [Acinetobacter bohemicus]MDM1782237.1 hypothetical protein [Acinetobacter indicus]QKQ70122.1 hypothetical protein E5Y90_07690 [Acinetobacter sp. 10FS3-1]